MSIGSSDRMRFGNNANRLIELVDEEIIFAIHAVVLFIITIEIVAVDVFKEAREHAAEKDLIRQAP